MNRVLEQIDTLREMLSFADARAGRRTGQACPRRWIAYGKPQGVEASLLLESSRQSKTGRQLAGWAAILAVPTAIAVSTA